MFEEIEIQMFPKTLIPRIWVSHEEIHSEAK